MAQPGSTDMVKIKKKFNWFQVVAAIVLACLVLIFLYVFVFYERLNPEQRLVVAENEIIEIAPNDYRAVRFTVPNRLGNESIDAEFEVRSDRRINAYVADSLGRFECEKQFVISGETITALDRNSCVQTGTIIEYRFLNVTEGSLNDHIREGSFYLVFDNLESDSQTDVTYSVAIIYR